MANIVLFLSFLLCMVIRPVFLAPALINTTPFGEEWTSVVTTETSFDSDKDTQPSLVDLINRVHDSRANNVNKNPSQPATTELDRLNSSNATGTDDPSVLNENVTLTGRFSDTPVSVTDLASFNAISDDVSITTFSALSTRAEISSSEKPWNDTSSSDVEEFDDTDNASNADAANVTINQQRKILEESDLSNFTIDSNETGRSDTSSEGNSSNLEKNRVIFVLPGPVNFSSHVIVREPSKTEFNESSSEADNSTETLNSNASVIGGREELSVPSTPLPEEDVTQELTAPRDFNGSDIEELQPSLNENKNSSLVDDVEFVLSHASNMSNSAFVNDLADLVSSISAMNGTASPEPEATPSGNSFNASEPANSATTEEAIASSSGNAEKDKSESEETTSSSSSTESLISITDLSLEEKSVPQNLDSATNMADPHSNSNDSTESNEIFPSTLEGKSSDGSVTLKNHGKEASIELVSTLPSNSKDSWTSNAIAGADSHSSQDSATNDIAATSRSNFNEVELVTESLAEINTDLISTAAIDLVISTEENAATSAAENVVTTDFSHVEDDETPSSTLDENVMQRNEISTEIAPRNESEKKPEIRPTESGEGGNDTSEAVESTTVSGDELFANTPLEYFINSTTIATLDLTTVGSIVGSQGSPPHSLLEIYNRHSPKTSCNHLGREYAPGQHVEQLDPCHFCVCVNGYLDCYWKNCPPAPEGCMELDFDGVCDRSLYLCPIPKKGEPLPFPANSIARIRREANYTQMTCDILGVQYRVGELIGVASDPCMECRCALDSLYCSPKCCFQPVESGQDPSKHSRANDAIWQPVLSHPLKHLRYDYEHQYSI